ncbi:unnamed protein product [Parajaminaea phylloscopi]
MLYASLLPRPASQLHAILARLHLPADDGQLLRLLSAALTHPSWLKQRDTALERSGRQELGAPLAEILEQSRSQPGPQSQVELATLGNAILGCLASESLHLAYPNLPNRVLKAALSSHVGPNSLADAAVEIGLGAKGLLKWDQSSQVVQQGGGRRNLTFREVLADSMRAVIAIMFQTKGMAATRSFVISHLLSRLPLPPPGRPAVTSTSPSASHAIAPLLKFTDPKRALSMYLKKHSLPPPLSRLIAETGRLSNSAVFGVAIYSATLRVGEGWGSNIAMAEYRAAEDALRRVMLARSLDLQQDEFPSSTLDEMFAGVAGGAAQDGVATGSDALPRGIWDVGAEGDRTGGAEAPRAVQYRPRVLGQSELIFGSKA